MLDYIVVGFGLAGLSFTEQLRKNGNTFLVIDQEKESSSIVAGGMYNPVILKRFTAPWQALEQLAYAIPFYKHIEECLQKQFLVPLPVLRIFSSIEEQNNWLIASDKPNMTNFLSTNFITNTYTSIDAPFNYGEVKQAGRLLVSNLLKAYKEELKAKKSYLVDTFNYDALSIGEQSVTYKDYKAKHIIFAEGFGLKNNPYFNYLPLNGTKGEVLIIRSESLNVEEIIKSGVFIIPQEEEDHYLVGATYHWTDKAWETTEEAKNELLEKLNQFVTGSYEVVNQYAGIRPTVKDRRPLIGQHPKYQNLYVLNGLGTRGVMVGPMISDQLYQFIENNITLDAEIDIKRFADHYSA